MSASAPPYFAIFRSHRVAVMLALGFASGLPLALTSGTLQAWLTVENVAIETIGLFSLVGLPYTLKFIWAPLMDRYVPPLLGRRRGWIALMQLALMVCITAMGALSPASAPLALAMLAVMTAFASASQDIAFDAYRADVLRTEERGAGAAVSVLGYRLGMLVSGGLALFLADTLFGWQATYWLMAALMLIGTAVLLASPEPEVPAVAPKTLGEAVMGPLKDFFMRDGAWVMLALIVLYKLGDAFAGSLTTAFLIRGVGFSAAEVGAINKVLGLLATIVGALAGGALMVKLGLFRSLLVFGILQAVSNLVFLALALLPKSHLLMALAVVIENLCGGMGTTAFVALLMALCNVRYSATQFALLSALSAIGRVYVGPVSGQMVAAFGWAPFFFATFIIALPGVALLWWRRETVRALDTGPFSPS